MISWKNIILGRALETLTGMSKSLFNYSPELNTILYNDWILSLCKVSTYFRYKLKNSLDIQPQNSIIFVKNIFCFCYILNLHTCYFGFDLVNSIFSRRQRFLLCSFLHLITLCAVTQHSSEEALSMKED